ncbi:sperm acrosome membrane-associated protein 6 [Malaclemys terrapin pileata]|uniref:sperm acrosome membrane-associated protein 6 n=1 Tax=Malaclemys terrapin pileata TaxID=2991368 RepID=UPI0023A84DB4|nr:sperm acrosome membrane-associated protein 6 [Malaclemys terrapin pileata]
MSDQAGKKSLFFGRGDALKPGRAVLRDWDEVPSGPATGRAEQIVQHKKPQPRLLLPVHSARTLGALPPLTSQHPLSSSAPAGRTGPPGLRSPPPALSRSRQPSLSLRPLTCEGSAEFTVPYQVAVPETVARIQPELAQLKPAPACVPPCGYQKDAQVYKCASCSRVACQLPLDCPVEDVWKNEGERTVLTCRVQFQTPPDVRHSWKFVKDLRTRDLSLFRDLHPGASSSIVLRPTRGSHRGTYACQLAQEDDVLARNYFYLNVTASSQGAETELQDMFRAILQSPAGRGAEGRLPGLSELLAEPNSLHKRNVVLLMVGLALSALLGTLLLGGVCRWAMGWP